MPVWNGQEFIRLGVESLLGQSFGDVELIITDNASTDGTQAICEEYARVDKRIRYYRNEVNTGLQANFAKALELAVAPYFMWGCHDDQWDASYVSKMVDVLDQQASVVLAGSNAASIDQHGVRRRLYDNATVYSPVGTVARAHRFIRARPGGGHATLIYGLMRTPVIQRIGYVPLGRIKNLNRGYYAIDLVTLFRMLFEGDFHVSEETLYSHRDVVGVRTNVPRSGWVGRLGLQRVSRLATRVADAHGYYGDLRAILGGSDLEPREKAALNRATYTQELQYYPALVRALLARRIRRV
jgi:glycosyltransferase involved in cell wall biosynthesis